MKEYFMPYYIACDKVKEITEQIEEHENKMYNASGITYDKIPNEKNMNDTMLNLISHRDILFNKLERARAHKKELEDKYINEIEKVGDSRLNSILRCFYIYRFPCKRVCQIVGLERSSVYRLRAQAIEKFKKIHNLN